VSVIVPALNEAAGIAACVESIRAQDFHGELEIIVADGHSPDGTADLAREAGAIVVDNPTRMTPAGLNVALAAAHGDVVVRFDAHAVMPPGYLRACLHVLEEEERAGGVNVGGWRLVQARAPWGHAIGTALQSRFGIGNPGLWRRPRPGERRRDVESVPLGCWRAATLRAHGGWNESFLRNQDYELNHRLRAAGGRIVFDPAIWSIYVPRGSPAGLLRQYWDYGRFKARMIRTAPGSLQPRQLAPVGLLAVLAAGLLPGSLGSRARLVLGGYGVLLSGVALRSGGGWRTVPVIGIMHVAWGAGLVYGLATNARENDLSPRA
jgi:succinoglycan biosynthesis protein ExoA